MNPAELRIGNILMDKVSNTLLEVIELTKEDIVTYVIDRNMFPLKDGWGLKPIPLTEEWLLKLGFIDEALECRNERIHKTYRSGEFILDERFILMDIDTKVEVKYIHQLQNLFYALTGEELKLQIPE